MEEALLADSKLNIITKTNNFWHSLAQNVYQEKAPSSTLSQSYVWLLKHLFLFV